MNQNNNFLKRDNNLELILHNFESYKDSFEKILSSNLDSNNIDELDRIYLEISPSFEINKKNQYLKSEFGVLEKYQALEKSIIRVVQKIIENLDTTFSYNSAELYKAARSHLTEELISKRASLDNIAKLYSQLSENVLSKPLFREYSSLQIQGYLNNISKRNSLMEKLDSIEQKYRNTEWDEKSISLLERFAKDKTFLGIKKQPLGGYSINDVISGFKEIDYFEGLEKAASLKQEILSTVEQLPILLKEKKALEASLKENRSILAHLPNMFSKIKYQEPDETTLSALSYIYKEHENKDFSKYEKNAMLSQLGIENRLLSEDINKKILQFLSGIASEFETDYRAIKTDLPIEEKSFAHLDTYSRFIELSSPVLSLRSRLPEISDTREKLVHKKYDSGLRQIEEVVNIEPVNYTDMVSHVRHLEGARVSLESIKKDVPVSFSGRIASLEATIYQKISEGDELEKEHSSLDTYLSSIKKTSEKLEAAKKRLGKNISMDEIDDFMLVCSETELYNKKSTSNKYLEEMIDDINRTISSLKNAISNTYNFIDSKLQKKQEDPSIRDKSEIYNIYRRLSDSFDVTAIYEKRLNEKDPIKSAVKETILELRNELIENRMNIAQPRFISEEQSSTADILPTGAYNKECGSFLLPVYLSIIGLNPYYFWFKETITDTGKSWEKKFFDINERFSTGQATNIRDYDYVQHLFYALSESINRGELTNRHSTDTIFRQIADNTLTSMSSYISRSENYMGLSHRDIEEHRPIVSNKNYYNNNLCSHI